MLTLVRRIAAVFVLCVFAAAAHAADLKLTTRTTMAGNSSEGTTYIKGQRQRSEMQMGPYHQVSITQCDKRQTVVLSDACRTYMVTSMDDDSANSSTQGANNAQPDSGSSNTPTRRGGTLTINTSATPTGETQKMFGYTARRIKSSMSMN